MGLDVPNVYLLHVPEPVYLVQRFDRTAAANDDRVEREHIIDTCQLLNESWQVKYDNAHLETLALALDHCQSKMLARIQMFRWLVFNVLVGNGDNHLKNISFKVTAKGVELAPFYDLLCTGVYDAVVYAGADRAIWPRSDLCVALGPVNKFADVTVDSLLKAGEALGLTHQTAERELLTMRKDLAGKAQALAQGIQQEAAARVQGMPAGADKDVAQASMGAESQLLRAIQHIVIKEMLMRLWPAT
jgi:serine/threonine-protein kinase HipA